jgi:hypothetical protein
VVVHCNTNQDWEDDVGTNGEGKPDVIPSISSLLFIIKLLPDDWFYGLFLYGIIAVYHTCTNEI